MDRIERKVTSMEDLYGRAQPKPRPPEFDAEDMRRMKAREETDLLVAREKVRLFFIFVSYGQLV